MCNRWKSGRDLNPVNDKVVKLFLLPGLFYAEQLEPLCGVLILDSLMCEFHCA